MQNNLEHDWNHLTCDHLQKSHEGFGTMRSFQFIDVADVFVLGAPRVLSWQDGVHLLNGNCTRTRTQLDSVCSVNGSKQHSAILYYIKHPDDSQTDFSSPRWATSGGRTPPAAGGWDQAAPLGRSGCRAAPSQTAAPPPPGGRRACPRTGGEPHRWPPSPGGETRVLGTAPPERSSGAAEASLAFGFFWSRVMISRGFLGLPWRWCFSQIFQIWVGFFPPWKLSCRSSTSEPVWGTTPARDQREVQNTLLLYLRTFTGTYFVLLKVFINLKTLYFYSITFPA